MSVNGKKLEELVEQLLDDDNKWVRKGAATVLGMLGAMQAIKSFIQSLKDKDSWVRWRAAEALGMIGDIQAIAPLEHLLQNEKREKVIEAAEKALEQLKQK